VGDVASYRCRVMTRYLLAAAGCLLLLGDALAQRRGGRQRGLNSARLLQRYDANEDGKLTEKEVPAAMWRRLAQADKDKDGALTKSEMDAMSTRGGRRGGGETTWKFLLGKYDADKDGKVSAKEYTRDKEAFARFDRDKDGFLTAKDWQQSDEQSSRRRGGNAKDGAPEEGDKAPDFTLTYVGDKKRKATLSEFVGKKPVALVFGSCT